MDKRHKKKLKRALKKKKDKAQAQTDQDNLKKQMGMFDRLPDMCSGCKKDFPKTREAHMSWKVVVQTEKEKVWLFCPACQEKAKELVEKNNEI
jgi:predicted Fe-S protein YdhL (DUF1289 family)